MQIARLFEQVDEYRPSEVTHDAFLEWLNRLDGRLHDCLEAPYTAAAFVPHTGEDQQTMLDSPYDGLYLYYMMAQVDLLQGDMVSYGNESVLFNALVREVQAKACREKVMPAVKISLEGCV